MKAILPFIRLTRLLNVLILVLLEGLLYFGYFAYYGAQHELMTVLSRTDFWIFVLITALLIIGGNVINDIKDIDIDAINKPDKQVVSKVISEKASWSLYHTLNVAALVLAVYWFWATGDIAITTVFVLSGVGMYFYSSWMKRKFLIGNLFVAILCALPPLLLLYIEWPTLAAISEKAPSTGLWMVGIIGVYSYFAFAATLYREVIKDIQDIPGDKAVGCTTMPVLVGGFMARRIALIMAGMLAFSLVAWLIYQWDMGSMVNSAAIVFGLIFPLGISILRLNRAKSVTDFQSVSNAIKLLMFNGIIYLLIVRLLIPSI